MADQAAFDIQESAIVAVIEVPRWFSAMHDVQSRIKISQKMCGDFFPDSKPNLNLLGTLSLEKIEIRNTRAAIDQISFVSFSIY